MLVDGVNLLRGQVSELPQSGEVDFNLTWGWTTPDADVVYDFEWTGKTIFNFPGPNEVDYGVGSREIRSALTDFLYIGCEKPGGESVYMAGPGSLEVIFLKIIKLPPEFWKAAGLHL